eukprot:7846255-Pyramimonas_sp.AAC.1
MKQFIDLIIIELGKVAPPICRLSIIRAGFTRETRVSTGKTRNTTSPPCSAPGSALHVFFARPHPKRVLKVHRRLQLQCYTRDEQTHCLLHVSKPSQVGKGLGIHTARTSVWLCWLATRGIYLGMAVLIGYRGKIPWHGYVGWLRWEYTFVWLCWSATDLHCVDTVALTRRSHTLIGFAREYSLPSACCWRGRRRTSGTGCGTHGSTTTASRYINMRLGRTMGIFPLPSLDWVIFLLTWIDRFVVCIQEPQENCPTATYVSR